MAEYGFMKNPNNCKIGTSYPIAPIFWLVTYISVTLKYLQIFTLQLYPPPKEREPVKIGRSNADS